jgi:hypothetical protein
MAAKPDLNLTTTALIGFWLFAETAQSQIRTGHYPPFLDKLIGIDGNPPMDAMIKTQ